MADIYTRMGKVTDRLLSKDKFGQGVISLVRYTPGPDPANPWEPPSAPTRTVTVLKGAARGVSARLVGVAVGNNVIVASDRQVTVAPFDGEYSPTDVLEIDGVPVTVLSVENKPAAGTPSAVKFIVRG